MIWQIVLIGCRPVWQLAILVLYSYGTHDSWESAILSVGGAMFVCTNLMLATRYHDVRWISIRKYTLLVEQVAGTFLTAFMLWEWPVGPAILFLLPTFVTYTWMFRSDVIQWVCGGFLFLFFLVSIELERVGPHMAHIPLFDIQDVLPDIILSFYAATMVLISALAVMVQFQKRRGEQLFEALVQVEQQSKQLSRSNNQLGNYAEQVYELATAEERNRIAGEIHDTVAHRLTALLVQLQVARRRTQTSVGGAVESVAENLAVCEALAREALDEVRYSVRAIRRSADNEGIDVLRRLVWHFSSLTHMEIRFDGADDIESLPAHVIALLYRIIQEGLTNAQRHGRATRVELQLEQTGMQIHLHMRDNGKGAPGHKMGFGLSSMRDRVKQLGGELELESTPGRGFSLHVSLPMWEGSLG